MATPALQFELQMPLKERVAIIKANLEHIQNNVADMKIDIRRLNDKIERERLGDRPGDEHGRPSDALLG